MIDPLTFLLDTKLSDMTEEGLESFVSVMRERGKASVAKIEEAKKILKKKKEDKRQTHFDFDNKSIGL